MKHYRIETLLTAGFVACFAAPFSVDATAAGKATDSASNMHGATSNKYPASSGALDGEAQYAIQQVTEAAKVVHRMKRSIRMRRLLEQAQGVFIVPAYGRWAFGVGAPAGEGVLLVQRNGRWSNPAFYNLSGISAGAQAGVEAGAVAFVLNNSIAVKQFMNDRAWSLSAEAGLTIGDWSDRAQGFAGKADVTVWADTEGLLGDLAIRVINVKFDHGETDAFYGGRAALPDVLGCKVDAPRQALALKQALQVAGAGHSGGGSYLADEPG